MKLPLWLHYVSAVFQSSSYRAFFLFFPSKVCNTTCDLTELQILFKLVTWITGIPCVSLGTLQNACKFDMDFPFFINKFRGVMLPLQVFPKIRRKLIKTKTASQHLKNIMWCRVGDSQGALPCEVVYVWPSVTDSYYVLPSVTIFCMQTCNLTCSQLSRL